MPTSTMQGIDIAQARKRDNQVTGNAGLYFTCYQLSRLGWNVMPTARNAKGVDLIAHSQDARQMAAIQVKALFKRSPVPLGKSLDNLMGDFWVAVYDIFTEQPSTFVLKPDEVRDLAHRGEKDGRVSYWLQPSSYDQPQFRENWDRISLEKNGN
jgi:hypothetical protein